jgi:hypothetical protein
MDRWGFSLKVPHQSQVVEKKVKEKFIEQVREL